jgi:cell division transport system permease protein
MSLLRSLYRVCKFAAQNILRNIWLSLITLTIFILTLVSINAILFVNVVAEEVLQAVEEKVEVTIYFNDQASEELVKSAQGYLRGFDQVRDVQFVSAQEALAAFEERYQNDDVITSSLTEIGDNPFGHSLVVSALSSQDFEFILNVIETPEYAPYIKEKDFTDYEQIIQQIDSLNTRVRYAGVAVAGLFALIALLIIFNTIRVAIYVHRNEIGIMKLVGANDWFVRAPFLLEAVFYSFFATVIMIGLFTLFLQASEPWMMSYFGESYEGIRGYFDDNGIALFLAECIALTLLSLLTTGYAMRKYLRV